MPQDCDEALKWLRLAADQGDFDAQSMLGRLYFEGEGVPQNYNEALKWNRLAADRGDRDAQARLASSYYEGKGVHQNYVSAHKWWNLAASRGNREAAKNRDKVAQQMTPEQIAEAQELATEWVPIFQHKMVPACISQKN